MNYNHAYNSTSGTSSGDLTGSIYQPEEALQSMCKQLLKSRLFRGYYEERRYVDSVNNYRDIVILHRTEKDLERLLLDVRIKLLKFYRHVPNIWVGITNEDLSVTKKHGLATCIWVELENLAFGQYWFSIKSVRFRSNEILVKLKVVRQVDSDIQSDYLLNSRYSFHSRLSGTESQRTQNSSELSVYNEEQPKEVIPARNDICVHDFVGLMNDWCSSIKHTLYDFMSKDISKDNMKVLLRFFGLLIVSIVSGIMVGVKMLGVFVLRFMFEISRLIHVLTPIILKIFEVLSKLIGGFYLLLAMIWKDLIGSHPRKKYEPHRPALTFKAPPPLKSLEFANDYSSTRSDSLTEFERKYQ